MSAYGTVAAPTPIAPLEPLICSIPSGSLSTYPVTLSDGPDDLIHYLHEVFVHELEDGRTYPQEGPCDLEAFITYYFKTASTTVIAMTSPDKLSAAPLDLLAAQGGRPWRDCVGGFYYIKPNYPGRSSHNCNAGFIVPSNQRGKKIGDALARSYLVYAPKLGYRASVFNLVYENNGASLHLWDKLGFSRVGRIPQAGRLKTGPNGEEEYIDAIIIYKSFV